MKRSILFLALVAAFSTANATNFGSDSHDVTNNTHNDQTYNQGGTGIGGAGGTGGAGGSASAGNVGNVGNFSNVKNLSPEATANANSTNLNTNTNANSNKQGQGQGQGQIQGQQQGQGQVQGQSVDNANNAKQKVDVNVEGDTYEAKRNPVSTAYAPAIAPTAPCMGSSSAGAQGVGFGISFGSSWTSEECLILETARSFDQSSDKVSALEVRCQAKYAKATTACKALAEKAKPAKSAEVKPALRADKTMDARLAEWDATAPKNTDKWTPVKSVPPAISSNGYYSVVTNPLGR